MSDSGSDGRCVNGTALRIASATSASPRTAASAYAIADGIALTSYTRDRDTGELAPRACVLGTDARRLRLRRGRAARRRPRPDRRARRAGDRGRQRQLGDLGAQGRRPLPGRLLRPPGARGRRPRGHERGRGGRRGGRGGRSRRGGRRRGGRRGRGGAGEPRHREVQAGQGDPERARARALERRQDPLRRLGLRLRRGVHARPGHRRAERVRLPGVRPVVQVVRDARRVELRLARDHLRRPQPLLDDRRRPRGALRGGRRHQPHREAEPERADRRQARVPGRSARGPAAGSVGATRYRVARGASATVQVRLPRRVRAAVARHGRLSVRVSARDADRTVRAARRTVVVSAR